MFLDVNLQIPLVKMTSLLPIQACVPSTFSHLSLLGAEILSIDANPVSDYDFDIPVGWRYSQPAVNVQNATFCNVTVTYTHTGLDDNINIEVWLPEDNWNGRLQSLGGGGWVAGRFALTYGGMAGAIHDGYATATTDAGLGNDFSPVTWGLISPGNLNLVALNNFGQVSLGDEVSRSLRQGLFTLLILTSYCRPLSLSKSSKVTMGSPHHTRIGTAVQGAADKREF